MAKRKSRILVVEDEDAIRRPIQETLAQHGYHVEAAAGGHEGLEAIQNSPPFDLAILDIKLPGLSGSQLLRYLEQESPQTEVIIISGYATPELRTDAVSHGAFTVLQKPFGLNDLLHVVDRLMQPSGRAH